MNIFRSVVLGLFLLIIATVNARAQRSVEIDLRTEVARAATARELATEAQSRKAEALSRARARGWETRGKTPAGRVFELMRLNERGQPMYYVTMNESAAISTGANLIRNTAPYHLNGAGLIAGVWDEGAVRPTHQEFVSPNRVVVQDGAGNSDHGTHVGGTIGAKGHVAGALGMAPAVTIHSYDWNSDEAEMAAAAATGPNQAGKIYVSNHSYGYLTGWESGNYSGYNGWHWFGWQLSDREDRGFGLYATYARDWDALCHAAPYFLPFKAAGNDRNDATPSSGTTFRFDGSNYTYDPNTHPLADGHKQGGYNTISYIGVAKNVMTVGAVSDAVSGGVRNPGAASMSAFSGWGPADDGRIKPDIVAVGVSVYSSTAGSTSSYATYQGTSMAAPNAAGSAMLLIEHYRNKFPAQDMRAATLKGLIVHTADDLGNPGPDYVYGWGLMNAKAAADHITAHQEQPGAWRMTESVLTSGQTHTYDFSWDGVNPIRATLSWTDPQGPAQSSLNSSTRVLVNDLDMRIVKPDGTTNFPYVLNPADYTAHATTGDNIRDNVEQVYIAAPGQSGTFTVRVTHKGALSGGSQAYSLLLSGSVDQEIEPELDAFEWDPIASPQTAGVPFGTTITARDQFGDVFTNFQSVVPLAGVVTTTNAVGGGNESWIYPLKTYWHDARTQSIYWQSELGEAARLTGLALDVSVLPGQVLNNWTIRLKHTSAAVHAPAAWEAPGSGWTTVYQRSTSIASTGWVWFDFDVPFEYDGLNNLFIDFSYNNDEWTVNGGVRATVVDAGRTVVNRFDSSEGDPLDWSGASPAAWSTNRIPNIRLRREEPVAFSPTQTTAFVSGVWNGSVTVQEEVPSLVLRTAQGAVLGESNPFAVAAGGPSPNYGMRDDGGVNLPTITYWHDGLGEDLTEQGASFARDLGERTALFVKGSAIKVWKSGDGDVTGTQFEYKLWEQGDSEPAAYTVRPVGWTSNDGGGDQTWANFGDEINIINGLSPGAYNLKALFTVQGTGAPGILSNGPHTATFEIASPPPPDAPFGQPPTDLADTSFTANWIGSAGATNYLLDVGTSATFTEGGGASYVVDFETGTSGNKGAYASGTVLLSGYEWDLTEALIGNLSADWKVNDRSARLRGYAASSMTMLEDRAEGLGEISFAYRRYGTDTQVDWRVEYSTNSGSAWLPAGAMFTAPAGDTVQNFSEVVNVPGPVRVRIRRGTDDGNTSNNRRLNIDNLVITAYNTPTYVPGYEARSVGNVSSYPVADLEPETDYYYRLRAQNEYGISGYSDVRMATTQASAPLYTTNSPVAVPFSWLETHFGSAIDHEAVALQMTGSGMTVWQEYVAGTDPTQADSRLAAGVTPPVDGNFPEIRWMGTDQPNRTYSIFRTTNLVSTMTLLEGGIPSLHPVMNVYTDTTYEVEGPVYYRIRVTLEE